MSDSNVTTFLPENYSIPQDDLGIRTHSRYVMNIHKLINQSSLTFDLRGSSKYTSLLNAEAIIKKLDIVKYTLDSIKTEYTFSKQDGDFLSLALSWLWIKGYYSLFHLLSLLISLDRNDPRYILNRKYNDHSKILFISNEILLGKSPFNIDSLNLGFTGRALSAHKTNDHENLKNVSTFSLDLYKSSLKKVYIEETRAKLKNSRGDKKTNILAKINDKNFTIFDLFLYYRERFNYSGFQYLNYEEHPNNFFELRSFYMSSYDVVISLCLSILDYLSKNTIGDINNKLLTIKADMS